MGETTLQELAKDYLKSEDDSLRSQIEEIESEIDDLEKEEEKYQDLEDDLLQEVREEKKNKKKELKELKSKIEDSKELEKEILEEILEGFQLEELNEEVLRALNGIISDSSEGYLLVRDYKITPEDDLDAEKKEKRLIKHQIKRVVKDILESDNRVEKTWEKIESGSKYEPFKMIARSEEGIPPDDVSEKLDIKRSTARGRMKSSRYQIPLNPYYVDKEGFYHLSLLGDHLKNSKLEEETKENDEETESKKGEDNKVTQKKFREEVAE